VESVLTFATHRRLVFLVALCALAGHFQTILENFGAIDVCVRCVVLFQGYKGFVSRRNSSGS